METKILIAESCIKNESGYMDITLKAEGDDLVVIATDHDGNEWKAKCSINQALKCLSDSNSQNG